MGYKVVWSPEALIDVDSIAEYVARDSEFYAASVIKKICGASRDLKKFPMMGRIVPEVGERTIRECLIYNYRLIYRVSDDVVTIAAVIHGSRLLDGISSRFGDR